MRKKFMGIALVLASTLLAGNVHAAVLKNGGSDGQYGPYIGYEGSNVTVEPETDGIYQVKLTNNAKQDLVILKGETAVLDLNGYKLENYVPAGDAGNGSSATIWIQEGAKVTIKGTGEIAQQSNTGNVSVIANDGELTIEGEVKISDGRKGSETLLAPTIGNKGTLIINGGTISTKLQNSAAIYNYSNGKMTINNVTITNDLEKTSGITNDGVATINNGTFTQGNSYSVILNRGDFTINNGTFKTKDGQSLGEASLITNEKKDGTTPLLKIKNGSFTSNVLFIGDGSTIQITGGSFSNSEEAEKYLSSGYEISNGKVVKKTGTVVSSEESKKEEVVSVEESSVSISVATIAENNTTYKQMLEKVTGKGYKTVFGAYELTTASSIGEQGITLLFKVGTNNNGKAAYILHQKKDGTFEEFNEVVKDGIVKITVKELSPFMIALGNVVQDDDMPKTSDIFPTALVGMIVVGLAGTIVYRKMHE